MVRGSEAVFGGIPARVIKNVHQERPQMWMTIGGTQRCAMTPKDNPTARAFAQLLPMVLDMPDLNGNEKHARLPRSLPNNAVRPGTIRTGDVMLYGSDTLVVFYETFLSSYSYTRSGRLTNVEGLVEALGPGSRRIGFELDRRERPACVYAGPTGARAGP